jgi:hypothetical protein
MLRAFQERLHRDYGHSEPLWCCLFIVICLPRAFLQRYAAAGPPDEGFLEYKMPTLARLWGTPIRTDLGFDPWWAADPSTRDAPLRVRVLNAVGEEISPETVASELARIDGARIFHPFVADVTSLPRGL